MELIRSGLPEDGTDLVAAFENDSSFLGGALMAEGVPVRFVAQSGEMGGTGPEEFYERWTDWLEPWETYRMYVDDVIDRGDSVVCLVRLRGVTKHGGVEMEHEGASIFRFEGDRVAEVVFTMGRKEALAD